MQTESPLEISCQAVHEMLLGKEEFLFIDCREQPEHETVHIPEAVLIPMSELSTRAAELGAEKQRRIVIHCHHGGRSLRVATWLREQGYSHAQSMAGGIDAWALQIAPGMARY